MFCPSELDINGILFDFGIYQKMDVIQELQRYDYEERDPGAKEVRLIEKVVLENGAMVVIRFKNEADAPLKLIEAQSRFAQLLWENGIELPAQYKCDGNFVKSYIIDGYPVSVTVEDFIDGLVKCYDADVAEKAGCLLAQTHVISEHFRCHVNGPVLFDPFSENDLFSVSDFQSASDLLIGEDACLFRKIVRKYEAIMDVLSPLREEPHYAVQGDMSDCNLFMRGDGTLGLFDFNRCGDNNLYCDAVMQAVFSARLMEFPKTYQGKNEEIILPAFLRGYQSVRPFTEKQKKWFPYFYAVITAFWSMDIKWGEKSFLKCIEHGQTAMSHEWLNSIDRRLSIVKFDDGTMLINPNL